MNRSMTLLPALLLAFVGLAVAFEPPAADQGDDTPRLKKKKRADDPPKMDKKDPDKPEDIKPEEKKDEPKKDEPKKDDKKPQKKEDMPIDEDGPAGPPAEDKQEVIERVARNMRAVEDGFANKEVNEGLIQKQDDIIKDLKSLLDDNNQGGGGGGGAKNQDQNQDQNQGGGGGGGGGGKRQQSRRQMGQGGGGGGQGGQGQQTARQQRQQRRQQQGSGQQTAKNQGGGNRNPGNNPSGNEGGNGGNDKFDPNLLPPRDPNQKLDVWGHLPESLRAQMAAYYSDKNFMAKHKDLISSYYRTIAAQGRQKGK